MVWSLAKNFMKWRSPGLPSQLEVDADNKLTLAKVIINFFISKVQKIVQELRRLPENLAGCRNVMRGKKISMYLQFVSVQKLKKLLGQLENKKSTSIDQLDNFAVKLAEDYMAEPCII